MGDDDVVLAAHQIFTCLLQSWVVGPLYGVNVVLAVVCLVQLGQYSRNFSSVTRGLFYTTCILVITTSAHAMIALTDLLVGFRNTNDMEGHAKYFSNAGRTLIVAALSFYAVNVHIGDIFMAWRAYVMWGHRKILAACYSAMIITSSGSSIAALYFLNISHTLEDERTHIATGIAWVISVTVQLSGSLLIGWRIIATPSAAAPQRFSPWNLLWIVVDSGAVYTCVTILALALSFPISTTSYVLILALGQISAFVPLSITLRECWKAEAELARERVNATSLLLINQRTFGRNSTASSTAHPYPREPTPEPQVIVDVRTTMARHPRSYEEDYKEPVRNTPMLSRWAS